VRVWKLRSQEWLSDARCRLADNVGLLLNQRDGLTPPAGLFAGRDRVDGSGSVRDFVLTGEAAIRSFIRTEGLEPSHRVLELGCGIGRMAIPLIGYLRDGGSYDGMDIETAKIRYCRKTISRRAPNFRFVHADIYNKFYNPKGTTKAADYHFPYGDNTFDFVFLESVFTHMLPPDIEHYLDEIVRVLVPGAKCVSTFFLRGELGPPFQQYDEVSEVADLEQPEHGVHYIESYVRSSFERRGLTIDKVIHGTWFPHPDANRDTFQDVIVTRKPLHRSYG
jgi:SAM-dependent methyltransferase